MAPIVETGFTEVVAARCRHTHHSRMVIAADGTDIGQDLGCFLLLDQLAGLVRQLCLLLFLHFLTRVSLVNLLAHPEEHSLRTLIMR